MPFWEPLVQACMQATPMLGDLLQQFWGVPVRVSFLSASTKTHYFWRADDYHVSQLMLGDAPEGAGESPPMALLRVSDAACSALLTRVLGPRPAGQKAFNFKQLSPLEATILNDFSRDLLADFMRHLVKKPAKSRRAEVVHLIWTTQLETRMGKAPASDQPMQFVESFDVGKIILSVPLNAIRIGFPPSADGAPPDSVPDPFFYHVETDARILLGTTRIPLSDLHQLEPEDLVVLENSQAGHMWVIDPTSGERLPFGVEIAQAQRITIPYTQELAMMETQQPQVSGAARQNLWDNLMIEVNAEFSPIKMPLKQLRQMSEGLVVEVGDIIDNRICLQVEGKTLAWGELVIVGDKFAVRVSQVAAAEGSDTMMAGVSPTAPAAPAGSGTDMVPSQDPASIDAADGGENLDTLLNDDFDDSFDDDEEEDWL